MTKNILIIDNEEDIRSLLKSILEPVGYEIFVADGYDSALSILSQHSIDVIVCDIRLDGKTGIDILEKVKEKSLNSPVIMMTGMPNIDTVMDSLRLGAFDYIIKPFQVKPFKALIKKALTHKELLDQKHQLEIENAIYRKHLEKLVAIRTQELELANQKLRLEIAERIKAQNLLEIQRDLGFHLNSCHSLDVAIRFSFEALFKIEEIDAAAFYLVDESTKSLKLMYHQGISEECVQHISYDASASDRADLIFQGEPFVIDRQLLEDLNHPCHQECLKFVAIMPVKHDKAVIAAIAIGSHRYEQISPLSKNAIQAIVSQVETVIVRIKAETALMISDQRREMAMEASSEGTWDYDLETKEIYLGPRWFTILGYTPHELPQSIDTFVHLIHPDDFQATVQKYLNIQTIPDSFELEFRMKSKDGNWKWILSKGKVFRRDSKGNPTRIVGTHRDITDRKLIETEILRTNLELDQIFNATSDGMCLVTDNYEIKRINSAMLNMFGWKNTNVIGKNFFTLFSKTNFKYFGMTETHTLPNEERIEHDFTIVLPDQRKLYLELTSIRLKTIQGKKEGFLFNIRNITRRVIAEEQARIKEQQLIRADKMKSLGLLVSGMAHEISNPNNFILLNTPILLNAWKDIQSILDDHYQKNGEFHLADVSYSEMKSYIPELLNGIQDGAQRIKSIITSLKEYARGGMSDLTEDVNINAVIKDVRLLMDNLIQKSTDHFEIQLEDNIPLIKGSFHRLEQVIINLIQNACQALTNKDQKIIVQTKFDHEKKSVRVIIQDEGVGIPKTDIEKIFDPFFTTKRQTGGCGLGLSICAGIVKEHGGELIFSSEVGKGTTVTLELPLNRIETNEIMLDRQSRVMLR